MLAKHGNCNIKSLLNPTFDFISFKLFLMDVAVATKIFVFCILYLVGVKEIMKKKNFI